MRSLSQRLRRGWVGFGLLLLLASVAAGCSSRASGKIEVVPVEADFGTIPNTAPVTHVFDIRNGGTGLLEITGLSTSCSCTVAEVDSDQIEPGEITALTVTFDPTSHNGATGNFMRQVYVRSNDPETPERTLTFWVEVVEP
jgi:hypothetical protein